MSATKIHSDVSYIEAYPVGLLRDWKLRKIKSGVRYLKIQIKRRSWRAVRSYFNGYLAEWHYPPEGMKHYKCGRGWTKRAAIRRLGVHIAFSNSQVT